MPNPQAERQQHVTLAIKRWGFAPLCACCPARHAVVARLARTLGLAGTRRFQPSAAFKNGHTLEPPGDCASRSRSAR